MTEQDPQYWRFKSDIWSTEDKQPNSTLVMRLHVALFLVNICFIKSSVTFVCYFGFDSCNQNWFGQCWEAAKSDMTNVGQTVQVFSQSGRCDSSFHESIMIKSYWRWASIKIFFFPYGTGKKTKQLIDYRAKSFSQIMHLNSALQNIYELRIVGGNSAPAIDFPLIRFFFSFLVLSGELMWRVMMLSHDWP